MVNYIKLIEQEPEFAKFLKDVLLNIHLKQKDSQMMIGMLYAQYQVGTSAKDTARIILNTMQEN